MIAVTTMSSAYLIMGALAIFGGDESWRFDAHADRQRNGLPTCAPRSLPRHDEAGDDAECDL